MSAGAPEPRKLQARLAKRGFRVRVEAAGERGEIAVVSLEESGDWERVFNQRDAVIEECHESGFQYATLQL